MTPLSRSRPHGCIDRDGFDLHAGCLRKSVDVYGRPWMAPRAGFEVTDKFLNSQAVPTSFELSTPNDTPRMCALDSGL